MELFKQILADILSKHDITVRFENLHPESADATVETVCYYALREIKDILNNHNLDDFECIEQIVCVFEALGSGGGSRLATFQVARSGVCIVSLCETLGKPPSAAQRRGMIFSA